MEPLATQLRPKEIEDVLGQKHILGIQKPFRQSLEQKKISSTIFWGPPGCGKTTLARLMAKYSNHRFVQMSAVQDGLPILKQYIQEAQNNQLFGGMLLFVDEIHRWNKLQQDALLPHIESGLIVLVGATTENPSYSINPALRSRCWILELTAISQEDIVLALQRGITILQISASNEVLEHIASLSSGDVRRALSILERIAPSAKQAELTLQDLKEANLQKDLLHDQTGDSHYHVISAFIKSMRGSDPNAALYWMARLLEGGEDPLFVARRMVIFASEDIGNADVRALPLAIAGLQSIQFIGMPEARITLGQVCTFLACAPKSNAAYKAINAALQFVQNDGHRPVPQHIGDPPIGYKYPHDHPNGYVDQNYWPVGTPYQSFYTPTNFGDERIIAERLQWWKKSIQKKS